MNHNTNRRRQVNKIQGKKYQYLEFSDGKESGERNQLINQLLRTDVLEIKGLQI
ncbi:TPA: hypothetical protein ACU9KK_002631 [Legionella anisa]|uniref:hypothetical protein n=1 Tax=Legionella anisa TaxID=28082 RepID=UPI00036CC6DE|nr:hypothetical protein [Legionella anisa]MCW8425229.1 hypothetical protein [Legionella anisa]MCW8449341.1 hypothetical protein [Legionella anisa]